MKRKTITTVLFMLLAIIGLRLFAQAQSTTPQQTLQQYVADLQRNPNDTALREKIIKLAQTMKPAPTIPESAREHYVMGTTFVEAAKDNSGYEDAIKHYQAALLAAPWWAEAYKKQAIAQKAAAHYDDAIASLNLYLLTQPADARDAQDEIYKLKALKQATAADTARRHQEEQQRAWASTPEGIAVRRQQRQQELVARLDGAHFYCGPYWAIEVHGDKLFFTRQFTGGWRQLFSGGKTLNGLEASFPASCLVAPGMGPDNYTYRAIISDDGTSIELHGGGFVCGGVWKYRLNDQSHWEGWCENGRRLTGAANEYCSN